MSDDRQGTEAKQEAGGPAGWDLDVLEKSWTEHLKTLVREGDDAMPLARIRFQAEQEPLFKETVKGWPEMSAEQREQAWQGLTRLAEKSATQMLPICVCCGICCKRGSPTLEKDDLELLRTEKIPWDQLVTLRKGEPAHSPISGQAFYLPEEHIKIREKPGTKECVFFDGETSSCNIYQDRPAQCRAQACWDPTDAREQAAQPRMDRRDIFSAVDELMELLDEHDQRCSFRRLQSAFQELEQTEGGSIDRVIDVLAFEEHFREFVRENLKIPDEALDLVFGRPLTSYLRLFGFRVEVSPEGTRVLMPFDS